MKLLKALTCEFLGTAFLLATVVGSGILGHRLDEGNVAVAVLAVAIATGCVLSAIIVAFGGISAHFNPAVTIINVMAKTTSPRDAFLYILTQIAGGIAGVVAANLMFELPAVAFSQTARTGQGQWLGEVIATFGLILVIQGVARFRPPAVPYAVAAYVTGAIWFTSSTCFANPAVTIARAFTDTLTGIRADHVAPYIAAQLLGAVAAYVLSTWLFAPEPAQITEPGDREILDALKREINRRKMSA